MFALLYRKFKLVKKLNGINISVELFSFIQETITEHLLFWLWYQDLVRIKGDHIAHYFGFGTRNLYKLIIFHLASGLIGKTLASLNIKTRLK